MIKIEFTKKAKEKPKPKEKEKMTTSKKIILASWVTAILLTAPFTSGKPKRRT